MERMKNFFGKVEYWMLERDLHIYLSFIAVVAIISLSWMLYTEHQKIELLRSQVVTLTQDSLSKDRVVYDLRSELNASKASTPTPVVPTKPVQDTVEKSSRKVTDKINKVQDALIQNTTETKTITKTKTEIVNNAIPVDSELKNMMQLSFCNNNPQATVCKKDGKK